MTHAEQIEQILQFEDLTDDERQKAEAHLAQCSACRELLAGVQSAETAAGTLAEAPSLATTATGAPHANLTGHDLQQAEASRALLLKRVQSSGSGWKMKAAGWGGTAMLLAACLVLVVGLPRFAGEDPLILNLSLTAPRLLRGAEAPVLQAGDSYVVRFTLAEAGWPVVVGLDAGGSPQVLYPSGPDAPRQAEAVPLVLPEVGSPVTWRLPAVENAVWVALSRDLAPDPEALRAALAGAMSADEVRLRLEKRFGPAAVAAVSPARP